MIPTQVNLMGVLARVTYLGLFMNVIIPATVLVILLLLRGDATGVAGPLWGTEPQGKLFFFALLAVTLGEFAATSIIRRKLPEKALGPIEGPPEEQFAKSALAFSIIIYSMNLSYTVYGVVLVILGMRLEVLMLFAALTMIAYQIFRPREAFLEKLRDHLDAARRPAGGSPTGMA